MSDYTKEQGFWNRLEIFCKGVTITNAMQEEEKEMILNICKEKKKEVVLSKKSINGK